MLIKFLMRWSQEEIEIIKNNMYKKSWDELYEMIDKSQHTRTAMITKAVKMGYRNDVHWTDEELNILKTKYSILSMDKICELLPKRKRTTIIMKAKELGVKNYDYIRHLWTVEEKQYIRDNWQLKSDWVMSQELNRTFRSIKWQREQLGLFRKDKNSQNYSRLSDYLRRNTTEWKKSSMSVCNYKCILSESKNFQIHHLIPVNVMIREILQNLNLSLSSRFSDFSNSELELILSEFTKKQNELMGVCVDTEIHKLFHNMYGSSSTPEQWCQFCKDYKQGLYHDYIMAQGGTNN